jgi:hypothetical protein
MIDCDMSFDQEVRAEWVGIGVRVSAQRGMFVSVPE